MQCEAIYCIYQDGSSCVLENTRINALGMCEECIVVQLDDGFLKEEKVRQRKEIKDRLPK